MNCRLHDKIVLNLDTYELVKSYTDMINRSPVSVKGICLMMTFSHVLLQSRMHAEAKKKSGIKTPCLVVVVDDGLGNLAELTKRGAAAGFTQMQSI